MISEYRPSGAMDGADEIERFYDGCSDLMRELLDGLAQAPDRPRPFPEIEDAVGWPHRRISSVLGGVCTFRKREFDGRRPYHFKEPKQAQSRRWEMWVDADQAAAIRQAQRGDG